MQSKLYQKCMQNGAEIVCKLCCKNSIFCVSKKVLQSDANEHFTRVSSRARKQTNKRTNKQTNKTPYGVMEKMYRKGDAEEEEKTKVKSERVRVTDVPVFG